MISGFLLAAQLMRAQPSVSAYQGGPAWVLCPTHPVVCRAYLGYERLGQDLGTALAQTINPTLSASTSTGGSPLVW